MQPCETHERCVSHALSTARARCDRQDTKLTPLRSKVLELVWASHRPVKAYDMLAMLQKEMPSAKPPTIYRALDFLLEQKLIHKLQRLNAFIGCEHPEENTSCYFFICTNCHEASELHHPALERILQESIQAENFRASAVTLEIEGVCGKCAEGVGRVKG